MRSHSWLDALVPAGGAREEPGQLRPEEARSHSRSNCSIGDKTNGAPTHVLLELLQVPHRAVHVLGVIGDVAQGHIAVGPVVLVLQVPAGGSEPGPLGVWRRWGRFCARAPWLPSARWRQGGSLKEAP